MAQKTKGITIQIGGDTTGLNKALEKTNSAIKKTQDNLKFIDMALKLDPTNVDLIAQKQRALADAVKLTTAKLKALKKAHEEAAKGLANGTVSQEQYDLLGRQIVFTTDSLKGYKKALAEASAVSAAFQSDLARVKEGLSKVESVSGTIAEKTAMASKVAAGVIAGMSAIAVKAMNTADDIKTLAQQTGLTTEEIQKMQYASDLVDVSLDSMTGALARLTNNMRSTSELTTQAFTQLGVSVVGADGHMRNANEVFYDTLQALSRVGNETERDQLAMQLFGRSANELAGIIDDGGASLKAYGEQAAEVGAIWSEETLNALAALKDQLDTLKNLAASSLGEASASAITALMPTIESFMEVISSLLQSIGSIDGETLKFVATLLGLVAIISPLSAGINLLSSGIIHLLDILPGIASFIAGLDPKTAALAATLAFMVGLIMQISNAWSDMTGMEKITSVLGALIATASAAAIALGAFQSAATLGVAAAGIVAGVIAVTAAINAATKRKNEANARGIPMMADGGELWRGSAVVGDAGPELLTMENGHAIVQPLTNNTYNNTTNNYGSRGAQVIQVTLDGRVVAQQLYDPLQEVANAHGQSWTR